MIEYSKEVMKVGKMLFELLSEALGLNTNHLKDMDCTNSMLLLGHYYPPCPQPDLTLGQWAINCHKPFIFFQTYLWSVNFFL
ncbi:unnamed protein product [Brassica rapa]|uniref:Uncharacterized protein n=1 Tax=Brassica campestris TaxID=3711 RepID=A0A8D9I202_BRACM|nr:unnamed protein product [Brassica rapa]